MENNEMMKKGFTLIELLAVIVIIAIIGTIGVYSVTKIINKSRLNSLRNSALAIKKAATLYTANGEMNSDVITLDVTPGNNLNVDNPDYVARGGNANIIELSKDPWGQDYKKVEIIITKNNAKYEYEIIIRLKNGEIYYLLNDSSELVKAAPLTSIENITGLAQENSILTAGVAKIDTGASASVVYQWLRCSDASDLESCNNIVGANSNTYLVTVSDINYYIKVKATGIGIFYDSIVSQATDKIAESPWGTGAQGNVIIAAGQTININTFITGYNGTTVIPNFDNLTINGTLITSTGIPLVFKVQNSLQISSTGKISANATGNSTAGTPTGMGGASYGGTGGNGILLGGVPSCNDEPLIGGALYGVFPIEPGMGSGTNQNADGTQVAMNIFGGGKIKIQAKSFVNQGTISADGQNALSSTGGGGSGGGIKILTLSAVDASKLSVKGGNGITGGGGWCGFSTGGGGGGRITIEATSYSGQAVMNGGSATDGAPGSIGVFSFVNL